MGRRGEDSGREENTEKRGGRDRDDFCMITKSYFRKSVTLH